MDYYAFVVTCAVLAVVGLSVRLHAAMRDRRGRVWNALFVDERSNPRAFLIHVLSMAVLLALFCAVVGLWVAAQIQPDLEELAHRALDGFGLLLVVVAVALRIFWNKGRGRT